MSPDGCQGRRLTTIVLAGIFVASWFAVKDCHSLELIDVKQVTKHQANKLDDKNYWDKMNEKKLDYKIEKIYPAHSKDKNW